MTPEEQAAARRARIDDLIIPEGEIYSNGFTVPDPPARYLAIEYDSGDPVWAINRDTLRDLARAIEESETTRDDVGAVDLDTGDELAPEFRVVNFWRDKQAIGFDEVTA